VQELLVGFAEYSSGQGQVEGAAHFTDFAQHHPAKDENDVRDALAEVIPSLEATLSPDERATALESDMPRDLDIVVSDTVVQELLDKSTPPEV
jgi:ATPase subunit of ABC transporter with duplicated ATPase domains